MITHIIQLVCNNYKKKTLKYFHLFKKNEHKNGFFFTNSYHVLCIFWKERTEYKIVKTLYVNVKRNGIK